MAKAAGNAIRRFVLPRFPRRDAGGIAPQRTRGRTLLLAAGRDDPLH
jgi:hypothetical protein